MHLRYESPRKLMTTLRDAGFVNLKRHWLPIMPSRLQRLQPMCESTVAQFILNVIPPAAALVSHSFLVRGVLEKK